MHVGETARITCPPDMAYGDQGSGPIPPKSTLIFDVEVLNCENSYWFYYYKALFKLYMQIYLLKLFFYYFF